MIRESIYKALAGLHAFVVAMVALGLLLDDGVALVTDWVVGRVGFAGLSLILLATDTLVTPFWPHLLLVVVARSDLARQWLARVLVLGAVSVCIGMVGWASGGGSATSISCGGTPPG